MKSVYLHGSCFGNNFGDVLLFDFFAKRICQNGFEVVLPFATKGFAELLDTPVFTGKDVQRNSSPVAGVFCGGGYLGEPGSGKFWWAVRNTIRYLRPYMFLKRKELPYGVFGVGFGPLSYQPFKELAKRIVNDAEYVCVRDSESYNYIVSLGMDKDVDVYSDVISSLSGNDIPADAKAFADAILSDGYNVGVHVTDKYKNKGVFDSVVQALIALAEKNPDINFLMIVDGISRSGRKLKQEVDAERILAALPSGNSRVINYESHWRLVGLIDRLDMVVTSKLHVGIVGCALGKNVVSIPYHGKTERFYKQALISERCLSNVNVANDEQIFYHLSKFYRAPGVLLPSEMISSSLSVMRRLDDFLKNVD